MKFENHNLITPEQISVAVWNIERQYCVINLKPETRNNRRDDAYCFDFTKMFGLTNVKWNFEGFKQLKFGGGVILFHSFLHSNVLLMKGFAELEFNFLSREFCFAEVEEFTGWPLTSFSHPRLLLVDFIAVRITAQTNRDRDLRAVDFFEEFRKVFQQLSSHTLW